MTFAEELPVSKDGIFNNYYLKTFTKKASASTYTADSLVVTINAAANATAINITGNSKDNIIKGGAKADTLAGGAGNDLITTGKGKDTIIYSNGNDTITDYTAGSDAIAFADSVSVLSAGYDGNNLTFVTDHGTLTVQNAVKKGKDQKITIIDGTTSTSQIYGRTSLTIGKSDGDTIDLSRAVNSEVTTVNASGRAAGVPITIIGNDKADNITGTKGADTIILSTNTGRGKATITYTAGNDKITNWLATDGLNLSNGQSLATATKVSDTNYKVTVNKSKKAVGTLDISGTFTTGVENSAQYKGTGTDTDTYYDITYYVNIGDTKVAYNVESKIKVTAAAYMERDYDEDIADSDIFADTILSTDYELDDITSPDNSSSVIVPDSNDEQWAMSTGQLVMINGQLAQNKSIVKQSD